MNLPSTYAVPCMANRTSALGTLRVTVPGSKSITNRALLLAVLANGTSTLRGALFSDDSRHFLECVRSLGFLTEADEQNALIRVTGIGGAVPKKEASLYVGSAGTAARFLTAYLGISNGTYHMDASAQMRKRPMAPLLRGLESLGCTFICEENKDCFPFMLHGNGFQADGVTVDIDRSSQFLSALLISSCLSPRDFTTTVTGSHGMAYVEMTVKMMQQFGVKTKRMASDDRAVISAQKGAVAGSTNEAAISDGDKASCQYFTPAGQQYQALDYQIEPDVSGAAYFYAMCPLLNLPVQVAHVHFDSLQGDVEFLHVLEQLGCHAEDLPEGILLTPPKDGTYPGITVDMGACSDQAITMAALAPFAKGPATITGIGHIRFQESDRLNAMQTELTKLGIRCETTDSSITIWPGALKPGLVKTYDDHRMAMGFTLLGLRSPGIVIDDPACCRKTFENYYEVLEKALCISPKT